MSTGIASHNVISRQQSALCRIVPRYTQQHHTPRNRRKTQQDQHRAFHPQLRGHPGATQGCHELNSSVGYVEENGFELVKAKGFNNQGAEGGDPAARETDFISIRPSIGGNHSRETCEIANIRENQSHVFRSRQASFTWAHFHWWFSTPCWFIRSLPVIL